MNPKTSLRRDSRLYALVPSADQLQRVTGLPEEVCVKLVSRFVFATVVVTEKKYTWTFPADVYVDLQPPSTDVALLLSDRGMRAKTWAMPNGRYALESYAMTKQNIVKCVFAASGARPIGELLALLDTPRPLKPGVSAKCNFVTPTPAVYNVICRHAVQLHVHGRGMADTESLRTAAHRWWAQLPATPMHAALMTWVSGIPWKFVLAAYDDPEQKVHPAIECDALKLAGSVCRSLLRSRLVTLRKGRATLLLSAGFSEVIKAGEDQVCWGRRSTAEWLALGLERLATSPELLGHLAAVELDKDNSVLSATDNYLLQMVGSTRKKHKLALVEMDHEHKHLPPCMQMAISGVHTTPWYNTTRWKMAKFFAHSARIRNVNVLDLAKPVLDALWVSPINRDNDRHRAFKSQLLNYAGDTTTFRPFPCNNMGMPSLLSPVGCPFASFGDRRVAECLKSREGDVGPHHLVTPVTMWNTTLRRDARAKRSRVKVKVE